jgi:hypothetical protein
MGVVWRRITQSRIERRSLEIPIARHPLYVGNDRLGAVHVGILSPLSEFCVGFILFKADERRWVRLSRTIQVPVLKCSSAFFIPTHLERERVETLVSGGASLADAKTQAQGEILSIFGLSGSSIGESEDLDIAQAGDANAILLAVSAVPQGDNTEAELTVLLSTIAQDLASDGTVSDTAATNEIRQNAMNLDLAAVRSYVEQRCSDLGVTAEVGGFESFVDSDGDGTVN